MIWVSAQEVIAFHDRILQRFPGVAGLTDPGRAQALIYRVQNRVHYEGVTDLFIRYFQMYFAPYYLLLRNLKYSVWHHYQNQALIL